MGAIKQINPDAVVFGSLAQARSALTGKSVKDILDALPGAVKLFDANLRKTYYSRGIISSSLEHCTIFKLNETEAETISSLLYGRTLPADEFAARIFGDFRCEVVAVTRGENGALAFLRDGTCESVPGFQTAIVDTVGAGDAFSAAFLASWLEKRDLKKALRAGNTAGAKTVSHAGAIPE
jgi:fructokinase